MQYSEKQQIYIVAWHQLIHLSLVRFKRLAVFFENDFEKAFQASIKDLMSAGLDKKAIDKIQKNRKKIIPEKIWENLQKHSVKVLIYGANDYPSPLTNISQPPAILFMRGQIKSQDFPNLAIVGSRKVSSYGQRACIDFVNFFVKKGITITSGLAYGTDFLAQKTAFEAGGRTIGFMANSIDTVSPTAHIGFVKKVINADQGAFLSEYLPGTEVKKQFFPIRNRLVAGFSSATFIIEAAKKSGTLITARLANESGKDVIALPGDIFAPNSQGSHQIISEGGMIASSPEEVWKNLAWKNIKKKTNFSGNFEKNSGNFSQNPQESLILSILHPSISLHIDDISKSCKDLSPAIIASNLVMLEMRGWVKDMGAQNYVKNL